MQNGLRSGGECNDFCLQAAIELNDFAADDGDFDLPAIVAGQLKTTME